MNSLIFIRNGSKTDPWQLWILKLVKRTLYPNLCNCLANLLDTIFASSSLFEPVQMTLPVDQILAVPENFFIFIRIYLFSLNSTLCPRSKISSKSTSTTSQVECTKNIINENVNISDIVLNNVYHVGRIDTI